MSVPSSNKDSDIQIELSESEPETAPGSINNEQEHLKLRHEEHRESLDRRKKILPVLIVFFGGLLIVFLIIVVFFGNSMIYSAIGKLNN